MAKKILHVGHDLGLPANEAQTQTLVVYGGKGMGKTNFAAVLAEEFASKSLKFSWIDPVGVGWGLKHSGDGRGEGIEILVIGGRHGAFPIEPTAGAVVADLVVDEDVSVLIDISSKPSGEMWTQGQKIRFVRDYAVRLFQRQGEDRQPVMQIIDEAGRFVPQMFSAKQEHIAECVGAIEQLTELGRNVGIGVTLITQRSARMNKSVSELAEMMIAFRTVGPRSIDSIVDWFGEHVPKPKQKELLERIRKLPRGTALVVSPGWLNIEGEYAVRARETFDSSDTPVSGRQRKPKGKGTQLDHGKYIEKMKETVEKAEASDPRVLQRQLKERDAKIVKLEKDLHRDQGALEDVAAAEEAVKELEQKLQQMKPVEVPVLSPGAEGSLRDINGRLEHLVEDIAQRIEPVTTAMRDIIMPALIAQERVAEQLNSQTVQAPAKSRIKRQAFERLSKEAEKPAVVKRPAPQRQPAPESNGQLTGPQQRVVDAIAWLNAIGHEAPTKTQVGFISGYRVGKKIGGTYANILGELRSQGFINYPSPGNTALTEMGQQVATPPDIEQTTEGLQQAVFERLDGPEQRVLNVLINEYPNAITKQELGEAAGYVVGERVGGTYANIIGRLRTLGLIDYPKPNYAVALPILFID